MELLPEAKPLYEEGIYLTKTSSSANGNRSHAIPLFLFANVSPLNTLYLETVCSLMHDTSTNSVPQKVCDLFTCMFI